MFRWSPWLLISLLATSCILDPKGEDPSGLADLNDVGGGATDDDVGPTPPPEATQPFPGGDDTPVNEDDLAATDEADATYGDTAQDTEAETAEGRSETDAGELDAGVPELRDSGVTEPSTEVVDAGAPDADSTSLDSSALDSATTRRDGGSAAAGDAGDGGTP